MKVRSGRDPLGSLLCTVAVAFYPRFSPPTCVAHHGHVACFHKVEPVFHQALNQSLAETDPELFDIIEKEKRRQQTNLVLIASENFASRAVFDALGSVMSNKYSEGYPGAR